MYTIQELEAMAPAETVAIAERMGMKKASSTPNQDVIYWILDNEATTTAKEQASKVARRADKKTADEPQQKKRGRKPKNQQPEQPAAAEPQPAEAEAAPEKKKRGRKPKNAQPEEQKPEAVAAPEQKEEAAPAEAPVAKRRGRPAKVKPEQQPQSPEAAAPAEPQPEPNPEKRKNPNVAFDSFFGKTKGRTFTPRGSQPQEPASAQQAPQQQMPAPSHTLPAPQQPRMPVFERPQQILIQEPGANSQNPKNAQKNKRQMQGGRQFNNNNRRDDSASRFPASVLEGRLKVYGVLEIMPEGFGFLRSSDFNYMPSPDDIYISQQQIKQYGLRVGDVVEASVRLPLPDEKYYAMVAPVSINGLDPAQVRDRAKFEHLVPLFPDEKFEITKGRSANISTRIVDMFAPIGKGQRALIVAPPKTGKTILLKDIANAISENHPETHIIMLLIDERPEEVTDMARSVNAEVIASTFDEPADRHVRIAGIVLEKAKRLVESGHDVVIMLDSITRLARAYNTVSPASGKILSGGVDANALQRPKRFFGAARNIEGGGSLTIIATALTETSSKMDEVIFEEFKGTGNMELQLDRKLSNKRIFPAVDIVASSTRRDDLLLPDETLNRMWVLRNYLGDMNSLEAMEFMKKRMEMTRSNEELLITMDK